MYKNEFEPGWYGRRRIVGVMGGKRDVPALTEPLGRLIASMGYHLLTGAGRGVMEGVSKSFYQTQPRQGLVLGVVRSETVCSGEMTGGNREYVANPVNPWVEVPVYTHLHLSSQDCLSRNHINVLTSDAVIVLPGSGGTASEAELALQYGVPLIFFLGDGLLNERAPESFLTNYSGREAVIFTDIKDVRDHLKGFLG